MNTSYVIRSESWVHTAAKEALKAARLSRKQELDTWLAQEEIYRQGYIKQSWFNKILTLREPYSEGEYPWYFDKDSDDVKRLSLVIKSTDSMLAGHMMHLSLEDSYLIEKYLDKESV